MFDAEQFVEEGMNAAGIVQDEQEREYQPEDGDDQILEEYPVDDQYDDQQGTQDEQDQQDEQQDDEQQETAKSYLTDTDADADADAEEKHTTQVPVSALQKERQRRRELEAELERIRQTPPEGASSDVDDDPLGDLDDDDYLTVADTRKMLSRNKQLSPDEIARQVEQRLSAKQQQAQNKQLLQKAQQLETEYRKANTDYDAVMDAAETFNLISNDDRKAAVSAANPAEYLHKAAKSRLEKLQQAFGGQAQTQNPNPNQNQYQPAPTGNPDEDIWNECFGGGQT